MNRQAWVVVLVAAALTGWVVPALTAHALVRTLKGSQAARRRNYRGRDVVIGLGIVWGVWAIAVSGAVVAAGAGDVDLTGVSLELWFYLAFVALPCVLFGLVDDAFGGRTERGFRGHLSALGRGRLTTGGLKLLGIGLVAMIAAVFASARFANGPGLIPGLASEAVVAWTLSVLVIALSANALNLLDLRPGRTLKAYSLLAVVGVVVFVGTTAGDVLGAEMPIDPLEPPGLASALLILLLGPVFATWRYDVGERAMQGDAGANAMGAVVGFLFAYSLPLWGLGVAAALLLVFNLGAERVSYSAVIERNALLRWLDLVGREDDLELPLGGG